FTISANGGTKFNNVEANKVGNYNVLLQGCSSALYDTSCTWEESHETFHHAFAAFPWEVLECFSPPPSPGGTGAISPAAMKATRAPASSWRCMALQ
ncbi:U2AF35A, partial [Symbiodinium necroappetens]